MNDINGEIFQAVLKTGVISWGVLVSYLINVYNLIYHVKSK